MRALSKIRTPVARPSAELVSMPGAWRFAQWGIYIVGPLQRSTGQRKSIIVAINYFLKWVKAKALASRMEFQVIKFSNSQVISCYGIPHGLINDKGPNLASKDLKWLIEDLRIKHRFASIRHTQTNRQVNTTNKVLLDGLKKRVDALDNTRLEELENVLWIIQTTSKKLMGETLFCLFYGSEAVALIETTVSTHRIRCFNSKVNNDERRLELDMEDEKGWASEETLCSSSLGVNLFIS